MQVSRKRNFHHFLVDLRDCLKWGHSFLVRTLVGIVTERSIQNYRCNSIGLIPIMFRCSPGGGGVCRRNVTSGKTECVSLCEDRGQTSCTCEESNECVVCCRDTEDKCRPALEDNATLPLSNGAGCSRNRVCINVSCVCVLYIHVHNTQ